MTMITEAKFQFDTVIDTKSVAEDPDTGDLLIEGWASDYDADRDEEAFVEGAFDEGLKSYLETNPVLLYNHRFGPGNALQLGVVEMAEKRTMPNGKQGLWFRARVANAEPGTEARDIYNKVKRGFLKGVSIGGKFYRRMVEGKALIWKADIMEFSLTPVPANPRALAGVAAKAFDDPESETLRVLDEVADRLDAIRF